MFGYLERELIEGEPWASAIAYSPVWNMANEEPEKLQIINSELTAKQPVNYCQNIDFVQFYLIAIKLFS